MIKNLNEAFLVNAVDGNLNKMKDLISKGADIHYRNDEALQLAGMSGHLHVVKFLVEIGLSPTSKEEDALMLSLLNGHLNVVKYLIEKGANANVDNSDPLRTAIFAGHLHIVKFLIVECNQSVENALIIIKQATKKHNLGEIECWLKKYKEAKNLNEKLSNSLKENFTDINKSKI